MNLAYVIVGIVMFMIALTAALWAYNIANDCKSLSRVITQLVAQTKIKNYLTNTIINIQEQCLPDIQHKAIELLIIGVIVYSIIGLISTIGGFKSKGEEEKMLKK
jgi:hypothetical protein